MASTVSSSAMDTSSPTNANLPQSTDSGDAGSEKEHAFRNGSANNENESSVPENTIEHAIEQGKSLISDEDPLKEKVVNGNSEGKLESQKSDAKIEKEICIENKNEQSKSDKIEENKEVLITENEVSMEEKVQSSIDEKTDNSKEQPSLSDCNGASNVAENSNVSDPKETPKEEAASSSVDCKSVTEKNDAAVVKESPEPLPQAAQPEPAEPAEKPFGNGEPSAPQLNKVESFDAADKAENKEVVNNAGNPDLKRNRDKKEKDADEEPEKKAKISGHSSKGTGKTPEQILELLDKTFDQRRKFIMKQMPTIPELKQAYPDLFTGKQLLIEFQRITKIDIDQRIQEFCVRYATAVIEMARGKKGAAPVLARWENAKQENEVLKQYWDMVTALCLLPLHFGENFVEMVLEIGEDEEVKPQGKIVPTLVARGNIFRTDEFFLIAENTIVQEFEEFTIAFASLYSSYWVFNMVYPETIENTYNYIQRCIVRQREPGSVPNVCKNFTRALQKWNKSKDGK